MTEGCKFYCQDGSPADIMRDIIAYAIVGEYINRFDGKGGNRKE